ncbi:outer membrane lipoprotein carrier protein LolA [Alicyclobacillus sp. SO9]|uniref:LolA family protein n=1 Tax=Alicyclobacillus sp. SO9 TaxID=2665646 RepID=UPI0018E89DDD|nr:outer membrane lipoprotein carrier protein LolA [Alicyclobacillus sp. SO9]QQE78619.1 outer membrane lipoprotein carrier protein LolA [Alicyclobacillus sp. SO9]
MMRKIGGWLVATGIVIGLVSGCGAPSSQSMKPKLQSHVQAMTKQNYKTTATMTVQMDHSSQTYYIETWYESPDVYRISLGESPDKINQVIVKNKNGMFIVSPSLQKVFRFNGNWAQNQGHIYLYTQILQQLSSGDKVTVKKKNGLYQFDMPVSPANDVVTKEHVQLDAKTLNPKKVVLYDAENQAVVTIDFKKFESPAKFQTADFNPQKIAEGSGAKTTLASMSQPFGYLEPTITGLGDKLSDMQEVSTDDYLLRYTGQHAFTLSEFRPTPGVAGIAGGELVDMFGVPAIYNGTEQAHQLMWIHNGVEFALTSDKLSMDQMKHIAITTLGTVGK